MKQKIMKHILAMCVVMAALIGCDTECSGASETTDTQSSTAITSLQVAVNNAEEGSTIDLSEAQYSQITNYNATINKAVTINGSSTDLNGATLTVEKDATISGITNAEVTASAALGNGSLKISSSSLSTLTINGGGINSINIPDVTVDQIVINKAKSDLTTDQYVRLCIDSDTCITGALKVMSNALIDVTGDCAPNAEDMNITFDGSDDLNVAFNIKVSMTTPEGKAKATFTLSEDQNKGFFIIVNQNKSIDKSLYEQVSTKIYNDGTTAYDESYNEIDFDDGITEDTTYTSKRKGYDIEGNISVVDVSRISIVMRSPDVTGDRSSDSWTFDVSSDYVTNDDITYWQYQLSYGNTTVDEKYYKSNGGSNTFYIGSNDTANLSSDILPLTGIYQLTVTAKSKDYTVSASETFELDIR